VVSTCGVCDQANSGDEEANSRPSRLWAPSRVGSQTQRDPCHARRGGTCTFTSASSTMASPNILWLLKHRKNEAGENDQGMRQEGSVQARGRVKA
jgi:hypothetical protein